MHTLHKVPKPLHMYLGKHLRDLNLLSFVPGEDEMPVSHAKAKKSWNVLQMYLSAQGCQMVHFQTKNPNLGNCSRVLHWKMLHSVFYVHLVYFIAILYFYGHLVYFVIIWYIFTIFVSCTKKNLATLYQPTDCRLEIVPFCCGFAITESIGCVCFQLISQIDFCIAPFTLRFCGAFLWCVFVVRFCGAFLWCVFVVRFCGAFSRCVL
jgi:hypothetical protein